MKIKKRIFSLALAGVLTLGLLPAFSSPALAADGDTNTYTVTIPSELTVNDKGWNEITGGIKAKGTLESGKKLTVTATSTTNSYKLKSGDNEIGYNLAKTGDSNSTYSASAEVPKWEFAELQANEDTTLTAGIIVEYFKAADKTAEVFADGWYHTGDTAYSDESGYLYYCGRNDDLIKSSGYRISPFEVESALLRHAAVRECAVTGVPDALRGFAVKATIVLENGYEGTPELIKELQVWAREQTAPYKYPRVVEFVDALPQTFSGKIRRAEIRKRDQEKSSAA